uniref:Methionine synthase n=1 Tax=candidate division WOR-3 bacterium TaxID=2052148 RepID=A0A7C6AG68_UNCW3
MNIFERLLKKRIIILDGATGTNLFEKGLGPGEPPANLNLKNPEAVYQLEKRYIDAGSDVILTNTFSANPINFKGDRYKEVIKNAIKIARRAAGNKKYIFGDIGPLGILIKPYGEGDFEEAYKIYREIFKVFYSSGLKTFLIETFNSIIEAKAAFLAGKEFSENILVSFTFQDNYQTIFGDTPESIAIIFDKLGAKAVGVNCTEPDIAIKVLKRMSSVTDVPLIAKPNAGKVTIEDNRVKNSISDKELAGYFKEFVKSGARLIGGCCGTTPRYIELISRNKNVDISFRARRKNISFLASSQRYIKIDTNSTIIVGERLNPSGRKKLKESLINKDYTIYGIEAKSQEDAGAQAIDVNAFVPEINEEEILLNCLYEIIKNCKLPIFIDTQNFYAAEKAMMVYPGIGVYNSIPSREKELKRFLPLVKKFGFKAVISLVGKKIPKSFKERMKNVELAIKTAKRLKFPMEDMVFDPLVFSVATEPEQVNETLKTVEELHKRGLNTILGISNVSFGLPERSLLNSTLVTLAINAGVNYLIINPLDPRVMENFRSGCALIKKEVGEYIKWIKEYPQRNISPVRIDTRKVETESTDAEGLIKAIVDGDTKLALDETKKLLDSNVLPEKIIDYYVFNGMKKVGENYEKGIFFIPDLLKSADATKAVLRVIRKRMEQNIGATREAKRKKRIVLATVKGDIHDIGKNIVSMVFESAGYEVIDLGKDVEAIKIVKAVRRYKPVALGLSALLTTTMPEMENVIKLLRKNGLDIPVIIGGPNVSEGFAKKIGAYAAAKNAFDGLKIIKGIA